MAVRENQRRELHFSRTKRREIAIQNCFQSLPLVDGLSAAYLALRYRSDLRYLPVERKDRFHQFCLHRRSSPFRDPPGQIQAQRRSRRNRERNSWMFSISWGLGRFRPGKDRSTCQRRETKSGGHKTLVAVVPILSPSTPRGWSRYAHVITCKPLTLGV